MADITISKFTTQVVRTGSTPSSPGFSVDEGQDPVNPSGTNNYVPYTGATQNVDLGEFGLDTGFVTLDTTPTNIPTEQGGIYWDDSRSTAALIMNGTLQHIGQDTFFYVKNASGASIAKGTAVRFDGTDGASGHLLIAPFLANGTYPSNYFMGVTAETIANGSFGQVMHFGELSGINTSGYTAGALLYASTSVAGGFQTTAPVAPNNIVLIAAAINSKNNGEILVRPTYGSNINQDEGVKIVSPTTGQLLQLQSNGLWENKTKAQVLGGTSSQFVKGDGSLDSTTYQSTAEKGQPSGYASLDSNGKVPLTQINDALIGNVNYQGLWNASTNTPTLANPPSSGTKGYYYIVSTAGTFAGISFEVGDWIISNGSAWQKVDNTDAVSSVFGRTGNVVAANGDYNTSQVTENTNLYFTNARVLATALTGYTLGTNTALAATDTILGAFGKVQGQLNAKQNTLTNPVTGTGTNNYLPKFTGTTTIVNSAIQDDGSSIVLGLPTTVIGSFQGGGIVANAASVTLTFSSQNILYGTLTSGQIPAQSTLGVAASGIVSEFPASTALTIASTGAATLSNLAGTGTRMVVASSTGVLSTQAITVGTVTSVAALTLGTTGTDLSSTVANGTTTPVITLNVPTASAANRGALSAADWTTFNNKENAIIAGTTAQYFRGDKTFQTLNTAAVPELANLYFTSARVLATTLLGYTVGTNTALSATDSILGAFGKVQGQINAKQNALNGTGFVKIAGTTISYDNTSYLPLTGGTLTGTLNGTTAVFSNTVTGYQGIFKDGSEGLIIGYYTGGNGYGAIYASSLTINNSNYALIAKSDNTILNAPIGGSVNVSIGNTARLTIASTGAATFTSSVEGTSIIRTGGTSSQYLMADGSVSTLTNPVTGTGTAGQVAYWSSTSAITGESNLFWDATNDRLGIGTDTPAFNLDVSGTGRFTSSVTANAGTFSTDPTITTGNAFIINSSAASSAAGAFGAGLIFTGVGTSSRRAAIVPVQGTNDADTLGLAFFTHPSATGTEPFVEAMRITHLGNVGIGTDSPTSVTSRISLHVVGSTLGAIFDLGSTTTPTIGRILVNNTDKLLTIRASDALGALSFQTGGANERMHITSDGNVGIGNTANLAGGGKLQVTGASQISHASDILAPNISYAGLRLHRNNATTNAFSSGILMTAFNDNGGFIGAGGDGILFQTYTSSTATTRMAITSSGNVGIGTNSPSRKLSVVNNGGLPSTTALLNLTNEGAALNIDITSATSGNSGFVNLTSTSGGTGQATSAGFLFTTRNLGTTSEKVRITSEGNVLIGTTTGVASTRRELVMRGASGSLLSLGNDTTADRFQIVSDSGENALLNNKANTPMILYTNNTERMRITSGGNVLIGTTTDNGSRLRVNGSVALPHTTKSANYTLDNTDYTVGFDCASNRTATLPDATTCAGRIYVIYQYNTNIGLRYVTIDGNGSQTINGQTTVNLQYQDEFSSVMIQSNGSNWVIIASALYAAPV